MAPHFTRREFLAATGVAAGVAALGPHEAAGAPPSTAAPPLDDPACLVGDPYLAFADGPGLGGAAFDEARERTLSFEAARERALRFRTPPEARDRQALGVDLDRA